MRRSFDRIQDPGQQKKTTPEAEVLDAEVPIAPEDRARIEKLAERADPTAVSAIPSAEFKAIGREKDYGYWVYESNGAQYVQLPVSRISNSYQPIVSRLFKGIMNVSDVVEGRGDYQSRYFSKILPLDRIGNPTSKAEIEADLLLFQVIGNDFDRDFDEPDGLHNLAYDKRVAAYFDFEPVWGGLESLHGLKRIDFRVLDSEVLSILGRKVEELEERVQGPEGLLFLESITKGVTPGALKFVGSLARNAESLPEVLQIALLDKIPKIRHELTVALSEREKRAA